MSTAATKGEAGFTLVELLVSLALLGMLSIALYSGLSFGTSAWRKATDSGAELTRIGVAQIALRDMLTRAYPLMLRPAGLDPHIDFEGAADRITFLTPATAEIAPGGFARTTIQFEQDHDALALVSYSQPELTATDARARHVLLRNVQDGAFAYFGAVRPNAPEQWVTGWRGKARLPVLIKVQISFGGRNAPEWPDLVIRPRLDADATCSFDPLTKSCRGL